MEVISSKSNEKIRLVRALQEQRKARERERLFVVEGSRMVAEAAAAGVRARLILHDGRLGPHERSAVNRLASAGAEVAETTPEILKSCSDTTTPPGLLAVLAWPDIRPTAPLEAVLVVDGVANPGNLGSLLRCAEAFGIQLVLLAPGCVDAFNPKVVRGAMGAHLRLPVRAFTWKEIAGELAGFRVFLAQAREGRRADQVDWSGPVAVILGGEAAGPGEHARALAAGSIHIPMRGKAESLNAAVAGGIILCEMMRRKWASPDS
jgi:TrmH family RNA methyltransferase